jgi:hypothetical protein
MILFVWALETRLAPMGKRIESSGPWESFLAMMMGSRVRCCVISTIIGPQTPHPKSYSDTRIGSTADSSFAQVLVLLMSHSIRVCAGECCE